jgi:ribosomal 50S subunit-associated protein YjgA (DUF615 family)
MGAMFRGTTALILILLLSNLLVLVQGRHIDMNMFLDHRYRQRDEIDTIKISPIRDRIDTVREADREEKEFEHEMRKTRHELIARASEDDAMGLFGF